MKLALLTALTLALTGATLVATAPEVSACYDECRVGPCSVYQRPIYEIEEPVLGWFTVRVSEPSVGCDL